MPTEYSLDLETRLWLDWHSIAQEHDLKRKFDGLISALLAGCQHLLLVGWPNAQPQSSTSLSPPRRRQVATKPGGVSSSGNVDFCSVMVET